jgi:hypothetical protein
MRTFTFSSKSNLPIRTLLGFAFINNDLISGSEGYDKYFTKTGGFILPGEDGTYITLNHIGLSLEIGTDFAGYMVLYLYSSRGEWAVSNSLRDLVALCKKEGFPLTRNVSAVFPAFMSGPLWQQPLSLRTPFDEIHLVPKGSKVVISTQEQARSVMLLPVDADNSMAQASYEDRLYKFVKSWVSRYITVLNSPIRLTCDVTGGLDSRANLALLLTAARMAGIDPSRSVHFNSNRNMKADLITAQSLAELFDFVIGKTGELNQPRIPSEDGYARWIENSIWSYWPVYFASTSRADETFWTGGAGGEIHRWITGVGLASNIGDLLERHRASAPSGWDFSHFKEAVVEDCKSCEASADFSKNSFVSHFSNFRVRFHHGRRGRLLNALSPLSGKELYWASCMQSDDERKSQRVFSDIFSATIPEMALVPFSNDYPNFYSRRCLPVAFSPVKACDVDFGGEFYGGTAAPRVGNQTFSAMIDMLRSDFSSAEAAIVQSGILHKSWFQSCNEILLAASQRGRFAHPSDGQRAAAIIMLHDFIIR